MKETHENKMLNAPSTKVLDAVDHVRDAMDVIEEYVVNAQADPTIDREFVERLARIKAREATR